MSWFNPRGLLDKLPKFSLFHKSSKDEEQKPYVPYSRGPRDTGPTNLPPWPQLVIALTALVIALVSAIVGIQYEWIGDVYVRGPGAFLTVSGIMYAGVMAASGRDEARERGEVDVEDEHM